MYDIVNFDFSRLNFIDGAGLTAFCNMISWLSKRGVTEHFSGYAGRGPAISYLDDCGFFERYIGEKIDPRSSPRRTTLPACEVQHANSYNWIELVAGPWIANLLGIRPGQLHNVKVCLKEIFNNINDHSTEQTGFVHFQHYPNIERLCMTVADFGLGIPAVIGTKYPGKSEGEAIEWASRQGVTTKVDGRASGAGLTLLLDYAAVGNGGSATIYSDRGGLTVSPGRTPRKTPFVGTGYFPGTLININFRTDTMFNDDDALENLQWP